MPSCTKLDPLNRRIGPGLAKLSESLPRSMRVNERHYSAHAESPPSIGR
jgi:hypothetical protein